MIELKPAGHPKAAAVFTDDQPNRPMLEALFGGRAPGRLFVDDADAPTAAIVVSRYGWSYLGGAVTQAMLDHAVGTARERQAVDLIPPFDGLGDLTPPEDLKEATPRLHFTGMRPSWSSPPPLPAGVRLTAMTPDLLEQCQWKSEIVAEFGKVEWFFEVGFGICGVKDGAVVSECYATMLGESAYELAPIVHEDYRRQGLAYATCAAVVDEARRRGLDTVWSCSADNPASAALARKLGYRNERPYTLYYYRPIENP